MKSAGSINLSECGLLDQEAPARERGAALLMVAGMLVALLGVSAFAVDLGWIYLNTARLQKAADAAALAGVVNLPSAPNQADIDAQGASSANDFIIGSPATNTFASLVLPDNKYRVTLGTRVDLFFLRVLGFANMDLTRRSTAQYVLPVPMGSPDRCFGFDPTGTRCSFDPKFWAAMNGERSRKQDGDPYSTRCLVPTSSSYTSCSSANAEFERGGEYDGYYYAIDVPTGASNLVVEVYDGGYYFRPGYPNTPPGDDRYPNADGNPSNPVMTTNFSVHDVDVTPHDPTDNPVLAGCTRSIASEASPGTYKDKWATICTLNGAVPPGIYVMHAWASGVGTGNNAYSVAATTTGNQPRVYGINDMSIFSQQLSGVTNLNLAEIAPIHAGKKLQLSFFDAGDADGPSWMRVRTPSGAIPNCTWRSINSSGAQTDSGSGPCEWQTTYSGGVVRFQNQWIIAVIDIPSSYTCGPCYWEMELDLSQASERTTWKAEVIGNPVRLVPNA